MSQTTHFSPSTETLLHFGHTVLSFFFEPDFFFSVFVTAAVRVRGLFLEDFTGTSLAASPELSFGTLSSELFTGVLHPEVDGLTPGFFSDGEPERCGCVG